jgi:hypothetical protein
MDLARGIAHVSFSGGGAFLPARDPYDRQTLVDHVRQRMRATGQVQVLVDDDRWMVRPALPSMRMSCARCGHALTAACYSSSRGAVAHCLSCAFGIADPADTPAVEEWLQAG